MIVAGLTGGIAAGKSTVSNILKKNGVFIVDADQVARDIVVPNSSGLKAVIEEFGDDYLLSDGNLDRKRLGDLVFNNPESMAKLNAIMAPLLEEESNRQIRFAQYQGCDIIVYDGPLICEMGNADKYRPLIVVHCNEEQQIERLMKRGTGHGPLTREQALVRINAQMPVSKKIAMADWLIDSSGTLEESVKQTETIYLCLKVLLRDQIMEAKTKMDKIIIKTKEYEPPWHAGAIGRIPEDDALVWRDDAMNGPQFYAANPSEAETAAQILNKLEEQLVEYKKS